MVDATQSEDHVRRRIQHGLEAAIKIGRKAYQHAAAIDQSRQNEYDHQCLEGVVSGLR